MPPSLPQIEAKFGEPPQPFAAQAYDSAGIALHAITLAAARAGGVPTRALVASIIRDTAGYEGITATYTFDAVGDPEIGLYYIIEVTSGDPAEWGNNTLLSEQQIASPLHALELSMMEGM
jgi:branched-chain amino acid transport system substrate-binding protein